MRGKKDLFSVILLLILAVFLLRNLLQSGIYSSHDSEVHVARLAQFNQAAKDGQFPPRWLASWNFGYGYPTFVYSYSLPYYLGAFLKIFIANFETIFKVLIFLSVSLSGVTFYMFARVLTTPLPALAGSVFYLTAPYRFADVYERGALGEAFVFIFLPLLFLSPHTLRQNKTFGFLITSLTIFAAITTHALTFLIFVLPAVFYSFLIFKGEFKKMKLYIGAIVFGFLLAAFQWLPMVFEQKYIRLDETYFNIFEGNFITAFQLLRIPKETINIGTGIQLGSAQILIILITLVYILILFLKKKNQNPLVFFFITTVIVAGYLITDLSKEIWKNFRPLQTLLFPWRFLTYTTFTTALLAALLFSGFPKKIPKILIFPLILFLAIFPSRHYLKGSGWHTFPNQFYASYVDQHKLENYYLPRGTTKELERLGLPPISIIKGEGQVLLTNRKSNLIEAEANLLTGSQVQFHTIYFPGWALYVDDKSFPLNHEWPNLEGLITASVPSGRHRLTLKFQETPLRKIGNLISLGSFLFLFVVFFGKGWLRHPFKIEKPYHDY